MMLSLRSIVLFAVCLFVLVSPGAAFAVTNKISANYGLGSVLIGPNSNTCNTGLQGALRFMSSGPSLAFCDGVTAAWTSLSGGSGSAAGSNTQIQFNSGSALGASSNFTWDINNSILGLANAGTGAVRAGNGTVSLPSHSFSTVNGGPFMTMSTVLTNDPINLTSVGATDWAYWGGSNGTPTQRKSGGGSLIGNVALYGGGAIGTYTYGDKGISWTDGTPTGSASVSNGIETQNAGAATGLTVTFPADTNVREARLYFGYANTAPRITAIMSDGSSANIVDTSMRTANASSSKRTQGVATIIYSAASASQTLTLRLEATSNVGNGGNPSASIFAATVKTLGSTAGNSTGIFSAAPATSLDFAVGGVQPLQLSTVASGVNYFKILPAVMGAAPSLTNTGTDTNGAGLGLALTARAASATGAGGPINIIGMNGGTGAGRGGMIYASGGMAGATGAGGAVSLTAANGGVTSGAGGSIIIKSGTPGSGSGVNGNVYFKIGSTPYITVQPPGATSASVVFNGNDALIMPSGTSTRPSTPVNGMIRYNGTATKVEGYQANTWTNLVSGGGSTTIDALTDGMTNYATSGPSSESMYMISVPTTPPGNGGGNDHTILGAGAYRYVDTTNYHHENTAFGALALSSSTQGDYDTAFGSKALCCGARGTGTGAAQAFGYNALKVAWGQNILGFGANTMMSATQSTEGNGGNQTGVGYNAGKNYSGVRNNYFFGSRAGEGALDDNGAMHSMVFGALSNITINAGGLSAVGAGIDPYGDITSGDYGGSHTIVGAFSFASGSLASGASAGRVLSAGAFAANNCVKCDGIYFGYRAGYNTTTGTDALIIGANLAVGTPFTSEVNIGGLLRGDAYGDVTYRIDSNQHIFYRGPGSTSPGVASCGTSPSVAGNDNVMKVTTGSGAATSCQINFINSWYYSPPICQVTAGTTTARTVYISALTQSSMTLTYPSSASQVFYIMCRGYL